MSDAQWALQKAVFTRLGGDAGLIAALGDPPRIHDQAPDRPVFPFLTLGEGSVRPHPRGPSDLSEHRFAVHVWSRWAGRREAKEIAQTVRAALENAALDLAADGHGLVSIGFLSSEVFQRRAGDVHQATVRFRAVTEPAGPLA